MSTLILRISDSKYARLKLYTKSKNISLNKLFDELATIALTQFDAKTKFELLASKGNVNSKKEKNIFFFKGVLSLFYYLETKQ